MPFYLFRNDSEQAVSDSPRCAAVFNHHFLVLIQSKKKEKRARKIFTALSNCLLSRIHQSYHVHVHSLQFPTMVHVHIKLTDEDYHRFKYWAKGKSTPTKLGSNHKVLGLIVLTVHFRSKMMQKDQCYKYVLSLQTRTTTGSNTGQKVSQLRPTSGHTTKF